MALTMQAALVGVQTESGAFLLARRSARASIRTDELGAVSEMGKYPGHRSESLSKGVENDTMQIKSWMQSTCMWSS